MVFISATEMESGVLFLALGTATLVLLTLALHLRRAKLKSSSKIRNGTKSLPPSLPFPSLLTSLTKLSWTSGPSLADINSLIQRLHATRGPITYLRLPLVTAIFVSDTSLARQILLDNGAAVADRMPASAPLRGQGLDRARVVVAPYGETWRHLRRNLVSALLNPSSIKHFAGARRWAMGILLRRLKAEALATSGIVTLAENFSIVSYGLLSVMCFGEMLNEKDIIEIKSTIDRMIAVSASSIFFTFLPRIVQNMLSEIRKADPSPETLHRHLRARKKSRQTTSPPVCYVDSLLEFELPSEGGTESRKLSEEETVALCAEFFGAGSHNTSIALEWIMAELVNNRYVQERLAEELWSVKEEEEEEMMRMPYLRAVVMEGLRRHPPSPVYVRHVVKEFEVGGYVVPKGAMVFMNAAAMGADGNEWEEPLEFRPQRFLMEEGGSGEVKKVMAFGEGRRACAGLGLAVLHLSYFVAYMVREFHWSPAEGDKVDLSEKMEFFMRIKNPLHARIHPREANGRM